MVREKKIRRTSEVLLAIAFVILVAIYYMVAAWIGFSRIKAQYGSLISGTVASVYMLGLLVTIVFAWTPTRNDQATLDNTWLLLFASFIGRAAAQLRRTSS
jgi:quinol-cytochrome oxidoreductase complex cytochrome b subunit